MKSIVIQLSILLVFCSTMLVGAISYSQTPKDTIVIIAHSGVNVDRITIAEVKRIFLKERLNWKTGDKVFPINAAPESELRKIFQLKVLGMDDNTEKTYWQQAKIKNGVTPPPEFKNVQKVVFSLKHSIGYCFKSEYNSATTKILLTI